MSGSESALRWRIRGRDGNPKGAFVVIGAAMFAGLLGFILLQTTGLFLGPAVVLASTADFLFGRNFELNGKEARTWVGPSVSAMEWEQVARVVPDGPRILLLPRGVEGWKRTFRGIALEPTAENREAVVKAVRERIPESAAYEA